MGVDGEILRDWVRNYEAEGLEVFLPHKNLAYSAKLKRQAVEEYLTGGGSYMKQGRETTHAERIELAKARLACENNYGEGY